MVLVAITSPRIQITSLMLSLPPLFNPSALMNTEDDPTAGFEKFQFLLQQNPCPPETFGNLLLLYCKYKHFSLAADVLAENVHLTYNLSQVPL